MRRPFRLSALCLIACASQSPKESRPSGSDGQVTATVDVPWSEGAEASPLAQLSDLGVDNVVVIEVDTLRLDRLSFYQSARDTMPNSSGRTGWVASSDHHSSTSWTNPSVATLFTGLDSHENGILTVGSSEEDYSATEAPLVSEHLAESGFITAFFNGNGSLERTNLHQGWGFARNVYDDPGNGVAIVEAGLDWLDSRRQGVPFVLHLRPSDTHRKWAPMVADRGTFVPIGQLPFSYSDDHDAQEAVVIPLLVAEDGRSEALQEQLSAVYDEEILGLDRALSLLLDGLAQRGLSESTLVVFTADHGETIFDRGIDYGHGWALSEELIRIPLIFFHPSLNNEVIDGCASESWDLYPTLFDMLGVEPMIATHGGSFLDNCRYDLRFSLYMRSTEGSGNQLSALAFSEWPSKLVLDCQTSVCKAYDLTVDPLETMPESCTRPTVSEPMDQLLGYRSEILATIPELSCDVVE